MANLTHAELLTPERVLFSGEAEAVILRADGNDTTFLANHMDYIGTVDICVMRIDGVRGDLPGGDGGTTPPPGSVAPTGEGDSAPSGEVRAAVHGGFVMVADNRVTVVAGVAELAEEIDVGRAELALEAAEAARAAGDAAEAEAAEARARVRLEAAAKLEAELSRLLTPQQQGPAGGA